MPTIPQVDMPTEDNVNLETGYPEGYIEAMNKSFVADMNLDGKLMSNREQTENTLKYAIPRMALGAFTEVVAALPYVSDEDATELAKSFTPDEIFNDFLKHKEGSQLAGAIGTSLIPILGVTKLMRSPKIFSAVEKAMGGRAASALLPSQVTMLDKVAKFREEAVVLAGKQQVAFTAEATPVLNKMRKNMALNEALDTLKIGLATDAGIYALLNESNFFFPEELTTMETAAFYGVPNVVVGGISGAMMRYSLKNVLRDVGGIAKAARNKAELPLTDIIATPGNRHAFIMVLSAQKNIKETEFAKAAGDPVLERNINSQIQELGANITKQVQLLAKDSPVKGVTKQWELNEGASNTINAALKKDFSALREALSIENYAARNAKTLITDIEKRKKSIDKEALDMFAEIGTMDKNSKQYKTKLNEFAALIDQKEFLSKLTPVKINPDGSMQLAANSKATYDDLVTGVMRKNSDERKITKTLNANKEGDIVKTIDNITNTSMYSVKVAGSDGPKTLTATHSLRLILPEVEGTALKYEELSFKGKTAAQVALKTAVKEFELGKSAVPIFHPKATSHHSSLDAMLELADIHGKDNIDLLSAFKFADDTIRNFDDVEFASLKSKYTDFVSQMNKVGSQKLSKIQMDDFDKLKIEDIIRTLNLPNDGVTGMHPIAQVFMDAYLSRAANLTDRFTDAAHFRQSIVKSVASKSDIEMFIKPQELKLRGSAYTNYEDTRNPVFMLLKSQYENPLHRSELISQVVGERIAFLDGLKNAKNGGAPMLTEMTEVAMRDPDRWNTARQVDSLVEGSQRGTDRFTQTMFGVDNQPAIIAMDAIRNEQDNVWRSYAAAKFAPHNPTFNKLLSHENTGDLTSFNIFVNQQGLGWRGLPDLVPVEQEGRVIGYKVALEDHPANKTLFKKTYDTDTVPEELFMPEPRLKQGDAYKELVISPTAAESVLAVNDISQDVLRHINYLRKQSGRPPIPAKALHMPAKNLVGKQLIYLIDKNTGQLATVKSGNTPIQVKRLAEEEIAIAKKQGRDLFEATDLELQNYNMVKLKAFTEMTDFSSPFSQTGMAKGTSFGQAIEIGPEVVTRMQEALINQYSTISKVSSAMIFQPELKAAEMALLTSGLQPVKIGGKQVIGKDRTIWHTYMNRTMGNKSGSKQQTIGKAYGAAEDIYDGILQSLWDKKISVFKGGQTQAQAASNFAALDKAVPDYNPFKDSAEFLENTMKIKTPHNVQKHMSALGNVTGLAMLRMFNVGLALVNIGTLPTLIPPVTKALARQAGQSIDDWKKVNAAWSTVIDDDIAIWNPTRAFTSGMHFMFSDEWKRIKPLAAKKGHLWQETVEKLQLFSQPAMGNTEKEIKKWIEVSAKFTDSSEEASRAIAYGTFFNMAQRNLKLGDDAAMDFAHHMANRVIGDFRPNNRPQMFQGAAGMPFSLFTTFAWNYMQRVFGYVEKGQMKSFMNQMGLQSAFFGAKSLPGFNQYVEHFTDNYDGTENMVDRLQAGFGTEATDWLMHGTVGGLTGMATYTKVDIPIPGSNFLAGRTNSLLDLAPATSMIKQTYKGIADSVKSLVANEGFNGQQLSEIASRSFPVRNMRGWFDYANGVQIDSRGQVLDDNTRSALDTFSRLTSIKTVRNQKVVEEFARQRSSQMRQNDIRQQSRMALRSAFRSGNLDGDFINTLAKDYLKSGGEPKGFKQFLKGQMIDGLVDKSYLRALELSTKQSKQKDYMRMMEIISDDVAE